MLETNGIKLGEDEKYVAELSKCHNLHVRLSFKTETPDNFEYEYLKFYSHIKSQMKERGLL